MSAAADEDACRFVAGDYNLSLRIVALFAVLAASAIGVYVPIVVGRFTAKAMDRTPLTWCLLVMKHFGTGVIRASILKSSCEGR
jgi:zinc transporter 1/2/3